MENKEKYMYFESKFNAIMTVALAADFVSFILQLYNIT